MGWGGGGGQDFGKGVIDILNSVALIHYFQNPIEFVAVNNKET